MRCCVIREPIHWSFTQTASEYWQRRDSLVHADSRGEDLEEHPRVRIYLFASSQHHAAPGIPPQSGPHQNPSNPLNTSPLLRALLVRLDEWATTGKRPPPGAVPRFDDDTLVDASVVHDRFPKIADVRAPESPNRHFLKTTARYTLTVSPRRNHPGSIEHLNMLFAYRW